ncbi:hypothetical protein BGS_0438 [Beggiatoa sp. SS]|nr:hypothetical protein BGS_0438 [Beggiatoa sp. SS]
MTALTRRINERYQLDITTALFSEHPSIAAVDTIMSVNDILGMLKYLIY